MTATTAPQLTIAVDPAYNGGRGWQPHQQHTSTSSTTKTVASDDAVSEHGRTFHSFKPGSYFLPNDAAEQGRLNLQHENVTTLLDGKLGLAPPALSTASPKHVLDVATGTGIWALEYAKLHAETQVVGSDLSLIQPAEDGVPNVRFVQGDAENDDWGFDGLFDYIHLRFMVSCFSDVNTVIRRIYSNLAAGGWVEFQDTMVEAQALADDGRRYVSVAQSTAFGQFARAFVDGMKAVGKDPTWIGRLETLLTAHGFVDVQVHVLPNPIGLWPAEDKYKKIGALTARNLDLMLESSMKLVLANEGWTETRAEELKAKVRREMEEGAARMVVPFYVVYARKPE